MAPSAEPNSQELLIKQLPRYTSSDVRERDKLNLSSGLMAAPWVLEFLQAPENEKVLTCGALLSDATELPQDHMFSALLKVGLIQDLVCCWSADHQRFSTLATLGVNVAGHPGEGPRMLVYKDWLRLASHQCICHGGLTAAVIDETLGGLSYMLKKTGAASPGPAFTVHLEVDYKRPIPAGSHIICTSKLESLEGRKTWVTATVSDQPDGQTYAIGKALFVVPKTHPLDQPAAANKQPGSPQAPTDERASTESGVARQSSFRKRHL